MLVSGSHFFETASISKEHALILVPQTVGRYAILVPWGAIFAALGQPGKPGEQQKSHLGFQAWILLIWVDFGTPF